MSTTSDTAAGAEGEELRTGDARLDAYTAAFSGGGDGGVPLLGHLVLYSIHEGQVTPGAIERWFRQLGLDERFLPPPIRAVDAFERVTGPNGGARVSYSVDDPSVYGASARGKRRAADGSARVAQLMIRPVRRDGARIVRHVVREVRDEVKTELRYDTRLATITFIRDHSAGAPEGAGTLHIEPDHAAIAALAPAEAATVHAMLADVEATFADRCAYYTADRLRMVVRSYVEHLQAVRVRRTGGVYFVHAAHADTLGQLRELVSRFEGGSHLVRIPIPDQAEMREMVVGAFTDQAREGLTKLSADIAAVTAAGTPDQAAVTRLYDRFTALQADAQAHAEALSTSLDDTSAALDLVKLQLGTLLATAGTGDDEPDHDDQQDDQDDTGTTGIEEGS